jgi:hypothetical protein
VWPIEDVLPIDHMFEWIKRYSKRKTHLTCPSYRLATVCRVSLVFCTALESLKHSEIRQFKK